MRAPLDLLSAGVCREFPTLLASDAGEVALFASGRGKRRLAAASRLRSIRCDHGPVRVQTRESTAGDVLLAMPIGPGDLTVAGPGNEGLNC
jgi:hypothetical protein